MKRDEYPGRARAIFARCGEDRDVVGAEVGCGYGDTSRYLLSRLPRLFMYQVDSFRNTSTEYRDTFLKQMISFKDRTRFFHTTSAQAALDIDKKFDFVFIDADHSYRGVAQDISLWWPKVKVGGFLCCHDYGPTMPDMAGVVRAVNEFLAKCRLPCETGENATIFVTKA